MTDTRPHQTTNVETEHDEKHVIDAHNEHDSHEEQVDSQDGQMYPNGLHPMLRYCQPYWWPYRTFVKQRWIGRQLLEVVCTEFRDRSVDYYRHALECGVTRVNGVRAYPELILRDGDRLDNTVHRHEPPVTNDPVQVLHEDKEREFVVVSKPGSMPVHAAGRYFKHTLLELLKKDNGITAFPCNRLDRLTSGLMILATSKRSARALADEFMGGQVKKEYIARVRGKFPEGEITVDKPLLTVDRQMGLVIVAPEGKEAKTVFERMSYDAERDQSVVHCRPQTGRTHQLRVHLQYLGYPIANDPLYSDPAVWGPACGKGGVELVSQPNASSQMNAIADRVARGNASNQRANAPPPPIPDDSARLAGREEEPAHGATVGMRMDLVVDPEALKEREYDNIDITSPILLSSQARRVIAKLRRARDEAEDWVKWKEVVWKTKAAQDALEKADKAREEILGGGSGDAKGGKAARTAVGQEADKAVEAKETVEVIEAVEAKEAAETEAASASAEGTPATQDKDTVTDDATDTPRSETPSASDSTHHGRTPSRRRSPSPRAKIPHPRVNQGKRRAKAVEREMLAEPETPLTPPAHVPPGFCHECYVPVVDDPDPATLFIYLHALRYTTPQLGTWETPLPRWAGEEWDGDWRGWAGQPPVSVVQSEEEVRAALEQKKDEESKRDGEVGAVQVESQVEAPAEGVEKLALGA